MRGQFRSRTWLWVIVVQFAFVNAAFSGGFEVLGPLVAKRDLGGAATWGLVVAFESAGFIVGGILALWHRPRRPLLIATYGVLAGVPVLLALAAMAPVPIVLAAAFVAGIGFETFGVQWTPPCSTMCPPRRCHGCTPTTRSARWSSTRSGRVWRARRWWPSGSAARSGSARR
jgi:hypothetical protein